ncbi:MAG: DUF937 domain-containing protein [Rhizobiales bacterium]|nr:DUF937 domain-containing protein [Hyphomicrobiales bacterium]
MAANLVSLIMQSITPNMISKMASALDLDRGDAQHAVGVSVPAILASFASVASQPGGGQQLSNAVAQQAGILDQLKNAIGGGGEKALAESGTSLLSSLLGGGALTALAGVVGRFAGIDAGASKSLLGLLGPIVAGVVGQQQRSAGLDAKGLTGLLTSQKDHIAAAMPSGFASLLGGTGLLDGLGDSWRSGAATASAAARRVSDISGNAAASAGQMAYAARGTSSGLWRYWPYLAAGLAALFLGSYFLGQGTNQNVAERPLGPANRVNETVGVGAPDLRLTNLTAELTSSIGAARSALQGITDPASARAALPKLQQTAAQLDSINSAASQLAPNARKGISSLVERSMPMLNQLFDKILATPQTAELAQPTINALRARLDALSRS